MSQPTKLHGSCICQKIKYTVTLSDLSDARTTICHCHSCRRAFGTNYGLTTKLPISAFSYDTGSSSEPKKHKQSNGVTREFCGDCGAFICEYGEEAANKFRYVMWGTFDEPEKVPPKGEFFCKYRAEWMPEIEGLFQKREIKE
ncbi:Mss4-like protein [Cladorrhinum sp. PSN259]|nr:Mss4-like protein [Cladorrhinum sp. PSN259]